MQTLYSILSSPRHQDHCLFRSCSLNISAGGGALIMTAPVRSRKVRWSEIVWQPFRLEAALQQPRGCSDACVPLQLPVKWFNVIQEGGSSAAKTLVSFWEKALTLWEWSRSLYLSLQRNHRSKRLYTIFSPNSCMNFIVTQCVIYIAGFLIFVFFPPKQLISPFFPLFLRNVIFKTSYVQLITVWIISLFALFI